MAKQDGWKPPEVQLETLLPVPSGPGVHYVGLQKFVGPFGLAGPRREAETTIEPLQ